MWALFPFPTPPPPHTSHELHFFSATSGFTMLSMKTKYVCRGLISLYVNFHNNAIKRSTNLHVKIRRWGDGKRALMCPSSLVNMICLFHMSMIH